MSAAIENTGRKGTHQILVRTTPSQAERRAGVKVETKALHIYAKGMTTGDIMSRVKSLVITDQCALCHKVPDHKFYTVFEDNIICFDCLIRLKKHIDEINLAYVNVPGIKEVEKTKERV